MTRSARAVRTVGLAGAALLAVAGCSEPPAPEQAPAPDEEQDVLTGDTPDPARAELLAALDALDSTVADARDHLDDAAEAGDGVALRSSASSALELLLDDPATGSAVAGVFPTRTLERSESRDQDDLLHATLASAREVGDALGRATVETLRDPLAGDLGAWERDAQGVVASARSAVRGAGDDVDSVTGPVMELPGDGVRALAWTFLATDTRDPQLAGEAAERASSHLAVVLVALDLLRDGDAAADAPADVPEAA